MKSVLIILVVIVVGTATFLIFQNRNTASPVINKIETINSISNNTEVTWSFSGEKWQASGNPPPCPNPLVFKSPVDVNLVSGILYPGQIRGDYKPHGGFRFDNRDTNDIEVKAIMDGYILKAARYEDGGEVQYFLFYVNECGLMVMHDHLLIVSPKLQGIFDKLPLNKNGDSRTIFVEPKVFLEKDEVLATEIGYKKFEGRKNIFVDFGLYDLRKTNGVNFDSDFRAKHPNINEYGTNAVCWFDYLTPEEERIVRSLPAGGHEGKVSDYCK